jgi:hypothetical protein
LLGLLGLRTGGGGGLALESGHIVGWKP